MPRKNLFDAETYTDCLSRIDRLTPETRPRWGTMDAAQMLDHCAAAQEVSNGKELKTPFLLKLFAGFIRKAVLSEKPYKRNLRTHPQYRQSEPKEFDRSKARLLQSLDQAKARFDRGEAPPKHPLFGSLTLEESGWAMFKHLNHHLSQFGV